ncbi:DUF3631 domain-containing protein [Mycolicibacterium chubuense]|uniref:DUF3631 domain-containing protein n=1 Tax=Mycolicibacterium chubuense TaxID=1800 RepID=UPI00138B0F67|nr:DUF3631 domain-containing protein [Mycolicibacterium chubuense]
MTLRAIEDRVLMHCHAGEQLDDVLAAVGLQMRDLFDDPKGSTYRYPDGREVHRSPDKTFRQSGNTKGRSLFRADRIGDAETVHVVEGEQDVLAVEAAGGFAVCSAQGAGKAHLFDWEPLRGKSVVIVADRDKPGRDHANKVAETLRGVARSVRIVEAAVGKDAADHIAAGKALDEFVRDEIDGAELLDDVRAALTKYVVLPDRHAANAVTLWIAATHTLPAFEVAPRLVASSPQKRCGKSRLLDVIGGTCHNPLMTVNATVPALFRSIGGEHPPTLIVDEADTIFGSKKVAENNEDFRALLNAGHQRGRPALRCVGPQQTPTEFPTFAMAVLAGIGAMPDTITDRAVNITMRRRAGGETVSQFRSRRDGPILAALRDRLAAWAATQLDALSRAEPAMPVEDRAADTWEPLIAVADAAGGRWPELARAACTALVNAAAEDDEDANLGTLLLTDIREVFTSTHRTFIPSPELCSELRKITDSPWQTFDLTPNALAYRLREYKIKTKHNAAGSQRGYRIEAFEDAFHRYLRPTPSEAVRPSETQVNSGGAPDGSDALTVRPSDTRQVENSTSPAVLTPLTLSDGYSAENGSTRCGFQASPPCFHCDKPVPDRQRDDHRRFVCPSCRRETA